MRRVALITGIGGFTGQFLADRLAQSGFQVQGICQKPTEQANVHVADLLDAARLRDIVRQMRPTHVVHLAAISFVAHGDAEQIYRTNIVGTRNLLAALADETVSPGLHRVLVASSANIYGNAFESPISEDAVPRPANDYAVSKLAMEYMASLWRGSLPITIVRPFNYTGVGQPSHFVVPKIVEAFRRKAPAIELGNLDVARDFTDVRDVVEAYGRLLECAQAPAVVNVCSGRWISLQSILDLASRFSGHSLEVRVNPAFVRSNDVKSLCGSPARLAAALGSWTPRPFEQTLEWMIRESDTPIFGSNP